ncbi:Uncharacterised protein [Bordetella pertussis]|nr:Uncharacterised protein [Bordetella pertussis]CFO33021.1 Uncharacterised protein [Bordetella pertussis]CFV93983.1 Uncharacterised protein [Bordetella pertussis]CFW54215.1 Uncharacterised protein [Bordetella pertussis]CPH77241.1 Uncharacterised protein [Bordetella pertussis]
MLLPSAALIASRAFYMSSSSLSRLVKALLKFLCKMSEDKNYSITNRVHVNCSCPYRARRAPGAPGAGFALFQHPGPGVPRTGLCRADRALAAAGAVGAGAALSPAGGAGRRQQRGVARQHRRPGGAGAPAWRAPGGAVRRRLGRRSRGGRELARFRHGLRRQWLGRAGEPGPDPGHGRGRTGAEHRRLRRRAGRSLPQPYGLGRQGRALGGDGRRRMPLCLSRQFLQAPGAGRLGDRLGAIRAAAALAAGAGLSRPAAACRAGRRRADRPRRV